MDEFEYQKFENQKRTEHKVNAYDKVELPFMSDNERKEWKTLLVEDRMRGEEE